MSRRRPIRKVDADTGRIKTVAGTGTACSDPTGGCGDGKSALEAELNTPADVVGDNLGNLYVADTGDQKIRLVQAAS